MKRTLALLLLGCSSVYGLACSSSTPGDDAGTDAATGNDAGNDVASGSDAGSDAAGPVNGCTTFTDMTADGGVIVGPASSNPSQYAPNCVHIKAGQSVTWNGDLTDHPLGPFGGDSPNPITSVNTGTTVTYAFPTPGTFGYRCEIHTSLMFGAVEVTQ